MRSSFKIVPTGLAGLLGCLIGTYYERYTNENNFKLSSASFLTATKPQSLVTPVSEVDIKKNDELISVQQQESQILKQMRYGFPSVDNIRNLNNFVLSYDRRHRNANWVFEHLTPESLNRDKSVKVDRSNFEFFEDEIIHQFFRASNTDYKNSGYDRGHLAAAGNHMFSDKNCFQTFILSNISPQVGKGFNRAIWNKLEQYVRYRAKGSKQTWVFTGPLYLPRPSNNGRNYVTFEVIGRNHIAVPTHFFKVLLVEDKDGSFNLESYVIQNTALEENVPIQSFQVPLESIERASGLLFFQNFPKKNLKSINGPNRFLLKFDKTKK